MECISDRMKALRTAAGLSQKDMADVLGLSRPGYQMMESGHTGKTFSYLPKIAKALGCRIDDLFPEMDDAPVRADGSEDEEMPEGWEM